ncbi:MAG: hypothetical protein LBT33_00475, partial [Spirochaetia bacterium]|nr:hypothetical protein [Spirochaetia bacterium]
ILIIINAADKVVGLEAEYTISGRALLQIASITIVRGEHVIIKREKSIRGEKDMKGVRTIRLTGNETDAELNFKLSFDPVEAVKRVPLLEVVELFESMGFEVKADFKAQAIQEAQGNSKSIASGLQGVAAKSTKKGDNKK